MRVLVTGDYGFIGTNLRAQLTARGWDLVNPARKFQADADLGPTLDVRIPRDVRFAVKLADVVVHLAARKGSWFCDADTVDTIKTNLLGSLHVMKWCALTGRPLVHFGTTAYYWSGRHEHDDSCAGDISNTDPLCLDGYPWDRLAENAEIFPRTIYGHTKWLAESMLSEWRTAERLRYMVIRPVYGYGNIGQFAASRSESWPDIILDGIQRDRVLPLKTDMGGQFIKDYTHITDIVDATERLLQKFVTSHELDGETVQVGAGGNHRFRDVVQAFDPPFQVIFDESRDYKGHQPHDYSKLQAILPGWRPRVSIIEYAQSRGAIVGVGK